MSSIDGLFRLISTCHTSPCTNRPRPIRFHDRASVRGSPYHERDASPASYQSRCVVIGVGNPLSAYAVAACWIHNLGRSVRDALSWCRTATGTVFPVHQVFRWPRRVYKQERMVPRWLRAEAASSIRLWRSRQRGLRLHPSVHRWIRSEYWRRAVRCSNVPSPRLF